MAASSPASSTAATAPGSATPLLPKCCTGPLNACADGSRLAGAGPDDGATGPTATAPTDRAGDAAAGAPGDRDPDGDADAFAADGKLLADGGGAGVDGVPAAGGGLGGGEAVVGAGVGAGDDVAAERTTIVPVMFAWRDGELAVTW